MALKLYGCRRKGSGTLRAAALEITGAASVGGALAVTGAASVGGVLSLADGTAGAPSLAFTTDTNSGFYRAGADIPAITAGGISRAYATTSGWVSNQFLQNSSGMVNAPSALQTITGVGQAITANAGFKRLASDASRTLTSVPTIAAAIDGQELLIIYEGANTLTLQDLGTLAGSNLKLAAATRALSAGDAILLRYSAALIRWIEVSFSNNV